MRPNNIIDNNRFDNNTINSSFGKNAESKKEEFEGIEIDSIDMDKEKVRCLEFMKKAKTADELAQCESSVDALGLRDDFDMLMDNFREAK